MNILDLQIKLVFDQLQKKVFENALKIKENNEVANNLLPNVRENVALRDEINKQYHKNAELTKENQRYNDLHTKLLAFLKELKASGEIQDIPVQYNAKEKPAVEGIPFDDFRTEDTNFSSNKKTLTKKEVATKVESKEVTEEEVFDKTIAGEYAIDKHHPYAKDKVFMEKLLAKFQETEEYEKCAVIADLVKKIK